MNGRPADSPQGLVAQDGDGEFRREPENELQRMMELAVQQGPDGVEALRQLVQMKREEEDRQAVRDFSAALAAFQAACPEIPRRKGIPGKDGRVRYKYAPLEDVVRIAGPHLHAHGFAWSFAVDLGADRTVVECLLSHISGHSRTAGAKIPSVSVPTANAAQNENAGVTYGKRSAFLSVTGLTTADEDSDGADQQPPDPAPVTEEQADWIRTMASEVYPRDDQRERFLAKFGADTFAGIPARFFGQIKTTMEQRRKFMADHPEVAK